MGWFWRSHPCHAVAPMHRVLLQPYHHVMVVEDLSADVRFINSIWYQVGMRFYMSCPLLASNGQRLGTIFLHGEWLVLGQAGLKLLGWRGRARRRTHTQMTAQVGRRLIGCISH